MSTLAVLRPRRNLHPVRLTRSASAELRATAAQDIAFAAAVACLDAQVELLADILHEAARVLSDPDDCRDVDALATTLRRIAHMADTDTEDGE